VPQPLSRANTHEVFYPEFVGIEHVPQS
jgi:hypothetical protein